MNGLPRLLTKFHNNKKDVKSGILRGVPLGGGVAKKAEPVWRGL